MNNVIVKINCESKKECYDLTKKILNDKVLVKYLEMNNLMKSAYQGKNIFYYLDWMFENCPNTAIHFASPLLITSSKKVLQRIRQFIKENHYENKYTLRDKTDDYRPINDFDDII